MNIFNTKLILRYLGVVAGSRVVLGSLGVVGWGSIRSCVVLGRLVGVAPVRFGSVARGRIILRFSSSEEHQLLCVVQHDGIVY